MNLNRIFGALLAILGTAGLIYSSVLYANSSSSSKNIKSRLIYRILGLIFFIAGIGLVPTTKD